MPGCSEVRDIQQEVNILLWEKMDQFKLGTNFGAWACTVAYYKVLDYRKKQKKNGFLVFSDELASLFRWESISRKPEALEAKRSALHDCLRKLTDKERALLDARYDSASDDMEQVSHSSASIMVGGAQRGPGICNVQGRRVKRQGRF
jgi:RNA polymerase sigma-70 factor (ECF subfamily)